MAVQKVMVMQKEDGALFKCDAIEHDGKLWLVPAWLRGPAKGTRRPARLICLEGLSLDMARPQYRVDQVLLTPLSGELLRGDRTSQNPLVIEKPDLVLRDSDFSD
jgi:hypothetical protein